ncbi:mandelate racemase/muconate lactonizing enzyme family protein [Agromyces sp. NPDC058104]|uniref:mandelate racemase/muconate lactonizing enzyme family protein n=1 Tax=Agromyces sp. NPDC058104 TaxID=3346342 RepID=UPI0036DCB2B8
MKIQRVETFPVFLSQREAGDSYAGSATIPHGGYRLNPPWRSLYSPGYESLFVKITTDDGLVGWGEALAPVAPEVPATIVDRILAPLLVGMDPRAVRVLWHRMTESMRERGHLVGHQADAMAAVDIALWDLWGKALDSPVAALAGGAFTDSVPSYVSGIRGADDAEKRDRARELAERGIRRFKLHLGSGIATDLATYDAVRSAHPDITVALDAHWQYSLGEAKLLGRELDDRRAWFFEAPLAPEDVEGHRELAEYIATPVAVGEAMRNRFEFADWMQRRAVRVAQPDIGRTGITEGLAIAMLGDAYGVQVAPHHSAAFGVVMAAGVHVSAATPALLAFEYQPYTVGVANRLLVDPLRIDDAGYFALPAAPGLGIKVDEAAVRRYILD